MKKIVSLMVAVMMLCCLTVTAFAGSPSTIGMQDGKVSAVTENNTSKIVMPDELGSSVDKTKNITVAFTAGGSSFNVTMAFNTTTGQWESVDAPAAAVTALAAAPATAITVTPVAAAAAGAGGNYVIGGNGFGTAANAASGTAAGVSPQTGETVAVYAVAAVVMAAAAAAFVVKARKA